MDSKGISFNLSLDLLFLTISLLLSDSGLESVFVAQPLLVLTSVNELVSITVGFFV